MTIQLDKVQQKAATMVQGPVLVVAGPGSGKTRVITARAAHLTQVAGVSPKRCIVVTFTKAAANELQERITALVDASTVSAMHIQTIHSLAYRWLSHGGRRLHILNEQQQRKLVETIVEGLRLPPEIGELYLQERTNCLNRLRKISHYQPQSITRERFMAITKKYQQIQTEEGFLDYDTLLVEMLCMLTKAPPVSGRYIMVDEFHDTSRLQYAILKCLAAPSNNLFAVADDDQSIYSWRGACHIYEDFRRDFPDAPRLLLTANYRSTQTVVGLSSALIAHNRQRLSKELAAAPGQQVGSRPRWITPDDEEDEAAAVLAYLKEQCTVFVWQEMAVIYRSNYQAFLVEQSLNQEGIPYRILGGNVNILDHWVTRTIFAYLTLSQQPDDVESFFYVLNRPGRFIPTEKAMAAQRLALRDDISPIDSLSSQELQGGPQREVARLIHDLDALSTMGGRDAIQYVRQNIGFDRFIGKLAADKQLDADEMLQVADILQVLPKPDESVADFVWRLPEIHSIPGQSQDEHGVTLTTCHSAKGLEFSVVALIGVVDGLLPHRKALKADTERNLEEERRLSYVAVTRSKEHLLVSSPKKLRRKEVEASPFVAEMQRGLPKVSVKPGEAFDHPTWGECRVRKTVQDLAHIVTSDGTEKKISLSWLESLLA